MRRDHRWRPDLRLVMADVHSPLRRHEAAAEVVPGPSTWGTRAYALPDDLSHVRVPSGGTVWSCRSGRRRAIIPTSTAPAAAPATLVARSMIDGSRDGRRSCPSSMV